MPQQVQAVVSRAKNALMPLPADTVVKTGHGDATTIGAELGRTHP